MLTNTRRARARTLPPRRDRTSPPFRGPSRTSSRQRLAPRRHVEAAVTTGHRVDRRRVPIRMPRSGNAEEREFIGRLTDQELGEAAVASEAREGVVAEPFSTTQLETDHHHNPR